MSDPVPKFQKIGESLPPNTFVGFVHSKVGRKESTGFIEKLALTFSKNFKTMDIASMFNLVKELMSNSDIEVCQEGTTDGTGVFFPSYG
jgi:hypothetical protein